MAKVELKQPVVQEISDKLDGAKAAVTVDYRGLTVAQDTALRKTLREAGITYKVYKNTMIRFAISGTEFEPLGVTLEGPTALAISKDDATAPARELAKFAKDAPALEFKGGVVEGEYYDAEGMKAVALIPGRDELIARLLGSMKSPITNLARVLDQIAENGGYQAPEEEAQAEEAAAPEGEAEAQEAPAEDAPAAEEVPAADEAAAAEEVKEEATQETPAEDAPAAE